MILFRNRSFVLSDPLTFVLPRWQKSNRRQKINGLCSKEIPIIYCHCFEYFWARARSLPSKWLNTGNQRRGTSFRSHSSFIYPASMWCQSIKLKLTYFPMLVFNLNAKTWLQPRGDNRFNNLITGMLSRSRNDRTNSTPLAIITRNADKRKRTLPVSWHYNSNKTTQLRVYILQFICLMATLPLLCAPMNFLINLKASAR